VKLSNIFLQSLNYAAAPIAEVGETEARKSSNALDIHLLPVPADGSLAMAVVFAKARTSGARNEQFVLDVGLVLTFEGSAITVDDLKSQVPGIAIPYLAQLFLQFAHRAPSGRPSFALDASDWTIEFGELKAPKAKPKRPSSSAPTPSVKAKPRAKASN
jgi:hypothetical protein